MKDRERGQSLVEAIIAMTSAILVVSAIVGAVVIALNNAQYSKYQNLATQYAQEGIEEIKRISVANWGDFMTNYVDQSQNWCLNDQLVFSQMSIACSANVYAVGNPPTRIFRRSIKIENSLSDCNPTPIICTPNDCSKKITSTVSWSDGKCTSGEIYCNSVVLRTCISRNQTVNAP